MSLENVAISRTVPFSRISKSSLVRPRTSFPVLSRTVAYTATMSDEARNVTCGVLATSHPADAAATPAAATSFRVFGVILALCTERRLRKL